MTCVALLGAACTRTACDQIVRNEAGRTDAGIPDLADDDGGSTVDALSPPDLLPECTTSLECPTLSRPLCVDGSCRPCNYVASPSPSPSASPGLPPDAGQAAGPCAAHPDTPLCAPSGSCVECLSKTDCLASGQACNLSTGRCAACMNNADCASGLCSIGACADPASLLYVESGNPSCDDGGSGAFATPYCTVQAGLDGSKANNGKTVIVLAGKGYSEGVIVTAQGSNDVVNAVGVGAVIHSSLATPITLNGAIGKTVSMKLDGFLFDGTGKGTAIDGVVCNGQGADFTHTNLNLIRSTVQNMSGLGVDARTKCAVILDADRILNNAGGGVQLTGVNFTVTNLLIAGNGSLDSSASMHDGSAVGGVAISMAGQIGQTELINCTIVGNSATTLVMSSGMACSTTTAVGNTVLYDNAGTTQITEAGCNPFSSAYVGVTTSAVQANRDLTGCQTGQLFVGYPNNDAVSKSGTAPCSLLGGGTSIVTGVSAPTHDLLGAARGPRYDIGAYQAK